MNPDKVKNAIYLALTRTRTIGEDIGILDKFTTDEVREFVDAIYANIPKTLDIVGATIDLRVLEAIPEHLKEDAINAQIKELLRYYISNNISKEHLSMLIALLTIVFRQKFPDDSITEELVKVVEFYSSYIIPNSDELQSEVAYNPTTAQAHTFGNYFIRVDEVGNLIPTRRIITEFNNYLFKK